MFRAHLQNDWIDEGDEVEMNDLKGFPFSRLPIGIQLEVIDGLNVQEKLELFNVNSGFRGYFARNGPFGRQMDMIVISFSNPPPSFECNYINPSLKKKPLPVDDNEKKLLCPKTRVIERIWMQTSCFVRGGRRFRVSDDDEETTNYFAVCFGNLRVLSGLYVCDLQVPIIRKILTALPFKVTDWAWLGFVNLSFSGEKDFSELAEFLKSYLEQQLKHCKKVLIDGWHEVERILGEIPGFRLEDNPYKVQGILDAFYKFNEDIIFEQRFYSKIKCYQRKIDKDEQGVVVVALR